MISSARKVERPVPTAIVRNRASVTTNLKNHTLSVGIVVVTMVFIASLAADAGNARFPNPERDEAAAATVSESRIVLAGGCFWGVQAVFQHVKGVIGATSGYAGGSAGTASYVMVSFGTTGHAESVRVAYDASQVTLGQLLKVFFSVVHDPTEVNRQGPDDGPQYRSVIFYTNQDQMAIARAYIAQLNAAKVFRRAIATDVVPLRGFYPAEAYHQDYVDHHPFDEYIVRNDLPKLDALRKEYPELYVDHRPRH
jgi:peptide-methionine (S)-S-oxide reductase